MILSRFRRLRADQVGAVVVLYAMMLTTLLGVTALVLDLSQVRAERQLDKSMADMAVRAGLGVLQVGPWTGICRAEQYILTNSTMFHSWDTNSEQWLELPSVVTALTSSPCVQSPGTLLQNICLPYGTLGNTSWGRIVATADGGRFTVEIDAGYSMPDPRFPEDQTISDNGNPIMGGCDNLAVIITERVPTLFSGVLGMQPITTTIRSVGRVSELTDGQYNPAVLLLEPHGCNVLSVSGNGTRLIAQPFGDHPGIIQIDSADDQGGCASNQAVLNGQSTSGGPSIQVCSATSGIAPLPAPSPGCNAATLSVTETAAIPSRVGIYALNWQHPAGDYVTSAYPGTYGDTPAVRSAQAGRGPVDAIYRLSVQSLDQVANAAINGNVQSSGAHYPPGCSSINTLTKTCLSSSGVTWGYLNQSDCNSLASVATLYPTLFALSDIFFDCNLGVASNNSPVGGLLLTGLNSTVVVSGSVSVSSMFSISDPRNVYIGGTNSGSAIGLDLRNGSNFNLDNPVPGTACPPSAGIPKYTSMVVGEGAFDMTSGAIDHLCQTFVYMANGFNTVPTSDGTGPCPCSGSGYGNYTGYISVASGSQVDWTAPNLIVGRRPTSQELATITPFEDLAAWTEAGGNAKSGINGGGNSQMTGVFFLPNANSFALAGNSGANVYLSAQFIAQTMSVTGGAVINVTLNPFDSVPYVIYQLVLVR
jgi:hypothetical protein